MEVLTKEEGWTEALRKLTVLPLALDSEFGSINFMRSLHYRGNAKKLFEEKIEPLLKQGRKLGVVQGFMYSGVSNGSAQAISKPCTEFREVILRDVDTDETFTLSIDASTDERGGQ